MANRSNRRRQNPLTSRCEKHEEANGSRRANSPSWSSIPTMPRLETGYTYAVGTGRQSKGGLQWGGVHIRTSAIGDSPGRKPRHGTSLVTFTVWQRYPQASTSCRNWAQPDYKSGRSGTTLARNFFYPVALVLRSWRPEKNINRSMGIDCGAGIATDRGQ